MLCFLQQQDNIKIPPGFSLTLPNHLGANSIAAVKVKGVPTGERTVMGHPTSPIYGSVKVVA